MVSSLPPASCAIAKRVHIDDGTGTVNLIEVVRVLIKAGYKPTTPLEFHWYSGEESGLLGSQDIAADYADSDVSVKAFMELDMTG